ncbi:MAG: hypothetical protein AABY90_09025, partial [Nitrospirota bacterium]
RSGVPARPVGAGDAGMVMIRRDLMLRRLLNGADMLGIHGTREEDRKAACHPESSSPRVE